MIKLGGRLRAWRNGWVLEFLLVLTLGAVIGGIVGLIPMVIVSLNFQSASLGGLVLGVFAAIGAAVNARYAYRTGRRAANNML